MARAYMFTNFVKTLILKTILISIIINGFFLTLWAASTDSGVPLGGIGTGKIEILKTGRLGKATINNGMHTYKFEMTSLPAGTYFGIYTEKNTVEWSSKLETASGVSINYDGLWPKATLTYTNGSLPIGVTLKAFSPIIPRDPANYQLPIAFFIFNLHNPTASTVTASVAFSWENLNGCYGSTLGSNRSITNILYSGSKIKGLKFGYSGSNPDPGTGNAFYGDYTIMVKDEVDISTVTCGSSWTDFTDDGKLSNNPSGTFAMLASQVILSPGQEKRIVYCLTWNLPNLYGYDTNMWGAGISATTARVEWLGHYYNVTYSSSDAIANAKIPQVDTLLAEVDGWHDKIMNSNFPEWLSKIIINNSYILSSNSIWTKPGLDLNGNNWPMGRFALREVSQEGADWFVLDEWILGMPATLLIAPELCKVVLKMAGDYRRPYGQIHHNFGGCRLDADFILNVSNISDYTNNWSDNGFSDTRIWTDLCTKWVLAVYRQYLYTGDLTQLTTNYIAIKAALQREFNLDTNGDKLPNDWGHTNAYDTGLELYGTTAYTSGMWLASLLAGINIANVLGDAAQASTWQSWFDVASPNYESQLWNEANGFYVQYNNGSQLLECHDGQLNGQWYADTMKLGWILPNTVPRESQCKRALNLIHQLNVKTKNIWGSSDLAGNCTYDASRCWPAYPVSMYCSECIYFGKVDMGLADAKIIHDSILKYIYDHSFEDFKPCNLYPLKCDCLPRYFVRVFFEVCYKEEKELIYLLKPL